MRRGDRRDTCVYDGEGGAWTEFFKLPLNVRKNRGVFKYTGGNNMGGRQKRGSDGGLGRRARARVGVGVYKKNSQHHL